MAFSHWRDPCWSLELREAAGVGISFKGRRSRGASLPKPLQTLGIKFMNMHWSWNTTLDKLDGRVIPLN